jgi:hypothetical protein
VRRIFGVLTSAVLALAFSRAVSPAAGLTLRQPPPDFASQLMLRLFGETSDSTAAFSAETGDRISESPLHELAFRVSAADANPSFSPGVQSPALMPQRIALSSLSGVGASYLARAVESGLLATDVGFGPSAGTHEPQAGLLPDRSALFSAAYQPVAPVPAISPGPGTLAFDGEATQPLPEASKDTSLALGSDNRAPKQSLDLSVSGQYQRAMPNDVAGLLSSSSASPSWQLPDGNLAPAVPNYAGSNRLSLGAGLAVPVVHGVTLNLNYDAQRSYGGYALPGLVNLDAANNSYVGRLTYNIPYSSSTLSISAYQNRFGESVLPSNAYSQTGEDVNFTVKF